MDGGTKGRSRNEGKKGDGKEVRKEKEMQKQTEMKIWRYEGSERLEAEKYKQREKQRQPGRTQCKEGRRQEENQAGREVGMAQRQSESINKQKISESLKQGGIENVNDRELQEGRQIQRLESIAGMVKQRNFPSRYILLLKARNAMRGGDT